MVCAKEIFEPSSNSIGSVGKLNAFRQTHFYPKTENYFCNNKVHKTFTLNTNS